jgi:CubicO group peptidase (beta-lactamase class C family)
VASGKHAYEIHETTGRPMNQHELQERVASAAEAMAVPGVAVGVHRSGEQHYAFHGVTNVEHPLPVDERTLFAIGSTGKTFTATAIMRLVEDGRIELGERVRTYVPQLRLRDEQVAADVTVLHLLNHTAGWEGDVESDTGDGDDALGRYVELLAELPQNAPLGGVPSYNNAALMLAGRVIEQATGATYERAIRELLLEPLGLTQTFVSLNDIMTRRFACGHEQHGDGSVTVSRPWGPPRVRTAAGGRFASSVVDQIAWARFHLGDGRAHDGTRVLSEAMLKRMQQQTAGEEPDPRYGIVWKLRDVEGVRLVEHGGDSSGQHSAFSMVPERDYAITVLTNCGPNGQELREELVRWALEAYLGVVVRDPEPLDLDPTELAPYAGSYETGGVRFHVTVERNRLRFTSELQPDIIAQALEAGEDAPEGPPPFVGGMIGDERFLILDGPYKGNQGYFVREGTDAATAVHLGRLAPRVRETAEVR